MMYVTGNGKTIYTLFTGNDWFRPIVSIGALVGWLLFVNFFALWMVPAGIAIGVLVGAKKEEGSKKKEKKEKKEKSSTAKDFKLIASSRDG